MNAIRWGVLSVANIGMNAVIPAIRHSRNGEVRGIASRSLPRAQDAARRLGIPQAYGSYEALLDDPDIEAVYIPLPNSMHCEWTLRAAAAGKHVLCEKPLGLTARECEEMATGCAQHGVTLMEAFMYRFHPRTVRVAQLAAEGAVGDVRLLRGSFTFATREPGTNIRFNPQLGGGAVYDVGCYGINVSRMILGEPAKVFAWGRTGATGVDEVTGALLRFSGDRLAIVDCALTLSRREEYEVVGTGGRIAVPKAFLPGTADAEIHLVRGAEQGVERIRGVDEYQLMVEHFGDVLARDTTLRLPPGDAVANLRVIEAVLRSLRSGRPEAP